MRSCHQRQLTPTHSASRAGRGRASHPGKGEQLGCIRARQAQKAAACKGTAGTEQNSSHKKQGGPRAQGAAKQVHKIWIQIHPQIQAQIQHPRTWIRAWVCPQQPRVPPSPPPAVRMQPSTWTWGMGAGLGGGAAWAWGPPQGLVLTAWILPHVDPGISAGERRGEYVIKVHY